MALPALFVGLIGRVLVGMTLAHVGSYLLKIFAFLGLSLATNELVVAPLVAVVDQAISDAASNPNGLGAWISFFRLDQMLSMFIATVGLWSTSRIFLTRI